MMDIMKLRQVWEDHVLDQTEKMQAASKAGGYNYENVMLKDELKKHRDLLIDAWHQFAIGDPKWSGGLSVLEDIEDLICPAPGLCNNGKNGHACGLK